MPQNCLQLIALRNITEFLMLVQDLHQMCLSLSLQLCGKTPDGKSLAV